MASHSSPDHRERKRRRGAASEGAGRRVAGSLEQLLGEKAGTLQEALQMMEARGEASAVGGNEALYCGLLALGSQLQEYGNRLARQHATEINARVWPFTQDLSVKIFSHMGAHDCAHAAAACTLFAKTAADPACYQVLDLVPRGLHVTMPTVNTLVRRAGHFLHTLKLGILPRLPSPSAPSPPPRSSRRRSSLASSPGFSGAPVRPPWVPHYVDKTLLLSRVMQGKEKGRLCPLGKQCLQVLGAAEANAGATLLSLHLYNIMELDARAIHAALAACPHLQDLEVIGLHVAPASVLEAVADHCPLLESLCVQPRKRSSLFDVWSHDADCITAARRCAVPSAVCERLAAQCPALSSVTIRGCILQDRKVAILLKKLSGLRYLDLCGAQYLTGTFLQDLVSLRECRLEHLLLRDCMRLREDCVESFLHALLSDECKSLRSLDVSNKSGLASGEWFARHKSGRVMEAVARLPRLRPTCWLTADFPDVSESGSDDDSDDDSSDSEDSSMSEPLSSDEESDGDEDDDDDDEDDEGDGTHDEDGDSNNEDDNSSGRDDDENEEEDDDAEETNLNDLRRARNLINVATKHLKSIR